VAAKWKIVVGSQSRDCASADTMPASESAASHPDRPKRSPTIAPLRLRGHAGDVLGIHDAGERRRPAHSKSEANPRTRFAAHT
jgi:hypothetical protein